MHKIYYFNNTIPSPHSRIKPSQVRARTPAIPTAKNFHIVVEAQNETVDTQAANIHLQEVAATSKNGSFLRRNAAICSEFLVGSLLGCF